MTINATNSVSAPMTRPSARLCSITPPHGSSTAGTATMPDTAANTCWPRAEVDFGMASGMNNPFR